MIGETLKDTIILDNIQISPNISRIMARLRFHGETGLPEEEVQSLLDSVISVSRPKAAYKVSRITARNPDGVEIDGVKFSSPLLRVNLEKTERVFPYCATCGEEADSVCISNCDERKRYCLDAIKEVMLQEIMDYLQNHLIQQYELDYIWSLNPGEMEAWPANHRQILFALLGGAAERIGLSLTPKFQLTPAFSQTGIFYYVETEFESCQLCAKEPCMGRRAPYNAELAKKHTLKGGRCGH